MPVNPKYLSLVYPWDNLTIRGLNPSLESHKELYLNSPYISDECSKSIKKHESSSITTKISLFLSDLVERISQFAITIWTKIRNVLDWIAYGVLDKSIITRNYSRP